MQPGGPSTAFVAPAARDHGPPPAPEVESAEAIDLHAQAWAAARGQALSPARIAGLYAVYVAGKQAQPSKKRKRSGAAPPSPPAIRTQVAWWGVPGQRGGARHPVEGCLGEYQADQLFAAQGHTKLNHDGQLVGLLDPPRGKGLDGVWKNATPPPEFFITETKFTTTPGDKPKLSKGQMSDKWAFYSGRLEDAISEEEAGKILFALGSGQVGKRLLHVDATGKLTEYNIDAVGKLTPLS